jgi:nucleoside-diphosphate-sugar epimerase
MKLVVVGAGYVGGALAALARQANHEVWAVRRSGGSPPAPEVRVLTADVASGAGLEGLPQTPDVVAYAVSPGGRSESAYRDAYPVGVARVLERAPHARFLLVSSTSVYGEQDGGRVDDDTPALPRDPLGAAILEAERLVLERAPSAAVVRASGIYGPGRTGLLARVQDGSALTPEEVVFTNRIHRDDLARVLLFLAQRPELSGTFVASDTQPVPLGQLHAWLAERLGVSAPPQAPAGAPRSRHRGSKRCVPTRLLQAGFQFLYPTFREGYDAVLAERTATLRVEPMPARTNR